MLKTCHINQPGQQTSNNMDDRHDQILIKKSYFQSMRLKTPLTVSSAQQRFVAIIPVGPLFNHPHTYKPSSRVGSPDVSRRTRPLMLGTTPGYKAIIWVSIQSSRIMQFGTLRFTCEEVVWQVAFKASYINLVSSRFYSCF